MQVHNTIFLGYCLKSSKFVQSKYAGKTAPNFPDIGDVRRLSKGFTTIDRIPAKPKSMTPIRRVRAAFGFF
jgi:hypothetical protein